MSKLKAQLPKISPTAISGESIKTRELMPVNNSGSEVTAAIIIKPNHAFPIPVSVAMISPYLESREPLKIISDELARNPVMIKIKEGIEVVLRKKNINNKMMRRSFI